MAQRVTKTQRRKFIRQCGVAAAVLGSGIITPVSLAKANKALAFRAGQNPLWLHFNENSLGMSPRAVEAAQLATATAGNRYPDDAVAELRETLGKLNGVETAQVIFGNGSTEVIQAVVTLAANRGATVIEPTPTFGDVRHYSAAEKMPVVQVPVNGNFETDIAALRARADEIEGPLLINICNPNNPTGTIVDQTALESWIDKAPDHHSFLIDEAYYEYAQANASYRSLLSKIQAGRENLVITRTFSKIYGMAGMRVGYGIAAPATAKEVRKFAAGYNMTAAGVAAALASLADEAFFAKSIQSNLLAKSILLETLDELNLAHVDSNTNFVLHRINARLSDYALRMRENGIRVGRRMTADDGWNRISVGTPEEMRSFSKTLREFRNRGWV
ncbi:MAG: histidinol-phosphate transaminase [Pseudomonadota bacterium]